MRSVSSSHVRLKDTSVHWLAIATSLLCHCVFVFLLHRCVLWCLISRPNDIYMPHKSQQGNVYFASCATAIRKKKILYMKYSLGRPALCATSGHLITGNITIFSTRGE